MDPRMHRRSRTGCLTCRRRRVKCDERKPFCQRCELANVECSGYNARRRFDAALGDQEAADQRRDVTSDQDRQRVPSAGREPARRRTRSSETTTSNHCCLSRLALSTSTPLIREGRDVNSLTSVLGFSQLQDALVALPNNPGPSERPCDAARSVLAYHQFLYRSIRILFAPEHHSFWLHTVCHKAWSCEYIFLAIVALGGVHRAMLLLSLAGDTNHARGVDTKVIALQTYIQAMKCLSRDLDEAKQSPDTLIATLVLLAYFECFVGNVAAAMNHTRCAAIYLADVTPPSTDSQRMKASQIPRENLEALTSCMATIYRMWTKLLPVTFSATVPRLPSLSTEPEKSAFPTPQSGYAMSTLASASLVCELDELVSDDEMEMIIWSPVTSHARPLVLTQINRLRDGFERWRQRHVGRLPDGLLRHHSSVSSGKIDLDYNALPMPPLIPVDSANDHSLLASATYSFYMGRLYWTCATLDRDSKRNECVAYTYFYHAISYIAVVSSSSSSQSQQTADTLRHCETFQSPLLPMLHIIGQCCPRSSWREETMRLIRSMKPEGLFYAEPMATNLAVIEVCQSYSNIGTAGPVTNFPPPDERVISVLIPELDGRSFTAIFAKPLKDVNTVVDKLTYEVIGQARWSSTDASGINSGPEIEMYSPSSNMRQGLCQVVFEHECTVQWLEWSPSQEFDLDWAVRVHISGGGTRPFDHDS